MSLPQNIFHLASSLVTPLTPSIVEPVHALISACPDAFSTPPTLLEIVYEFIEVVIQPSDVASSHKSS